MDNLATALDAAKWKEIVTVQANTSDHNEPPAVVNLVATMDTQHGGLQWNAVPNDQVVARHLEAKQWIMPMLNDTHRNDLYFQAIGQALAHLQQQSVVLPDDITNKKNIDRAHVMKPSTPLRVLDLGCGTGLLGMMALRQCPDAIITGVDMSSVMVHLATQTVAENQLLQDDKITILEGHSTQMIPAQANLCVSELLEDGLLGEGWIPAVRDAWARHMATNITTTIKHPIMIPSGATVYAQLVQGEWLRDYVGPRLFTTAQSSHTNIIDVGSANRISTGVVPMHVVHLIKEGHITPLSDPVRIFEFDVSDPESVPGPEGRQTQRNISATQQGTVHAVLVWWTIELYPGIFYELYNRDADSVISQDHWHPCLHILETPLATESDQSWTLMSRHDDYSVSVSLEPLEHLNKEPAPNKRGKLSPNVVASTTTTQQSLLCPERVFQMNAKRWTALENGIHDELQQPKDGQAFNLVLDVSDFAIGAMLAASQTNCHPSVFSLERIHAVAAAQAIQSSGLASRVHVLQGHLEQINHDQLLSMSGTDRKEKNCVLVIGEPAYSQLLYWPHLEAMQYYYMIQSLRKRLGEANNNNNNSGPSWHITSVPKMARLVAAAIQAPELTKAYGACTALKNDYNLDHSYVISEHFARSHHGGEDGGGGGVRELSLSLWQYNYTLLTDPVIVNELPYNKAVPSMETAVSETIFTRTGTCHGVVVWVEYEFGSDSSVAGGRPTPTTWSNHPTVLGTRQLVYIWQTPVSIHNLEEVPMLLQARVDLFPEPKFQFCVSK